MLDRSPVYRGLASGLVVLMTVVFLVSGVAAGPRIAIDDNIFVFGKVPRHATVSHSFWIKSVGDDTLRINKVVPGCGCTQAPLADSVLAPGDSTMLEIIFSTKNFRGTVSKRPYLETNVSEHKVYVKIESNVLIDPSAATPVRLKPYKLDISQLGSKLRREATFTIENMADIDLQLVVVDTANRHFEISVPEKIKAGEKITGTIVVRDSGLNRAFEQSVTFQLNDPKKTRITLPIRRLYRPGGATKASAGTK